LHELDISWLGHLGSSGPAMASIGEAASSLEDLNLRGASVDDASVSHFISYFPRLEFLELEYNSGLTDAGARSIARNGSPRLTYVGLGECDDLSAEVRCDEDLTLLLRKLRAAQPNLSLANAQYRMALPRRGGGETTTMDRLARDMVAGISCTRGTGIGSARAHAAICIDPPHGTPLIAHAVVIRRAPCTSCAPQRSGVSTWVLAGGTRASGRRLGASAADAGVAAARVCMNGSFNILTRQGGSGRVGH
jgi:hypothetical protein